MRAVMTLPKIFKEKLICEPFQNIFPNRNRILKNIHKNFWRPKMKLFIGVCVWCFCVCARM